MTTRKILGSIFVMILLIGVGTVLLHPSTLLAQGPSQEKPSPAGPQPIVRYDLKHTHTPPLRDLPHLANPTLQQPARETFSALPLPFHGGQEPQNPTKDMARQPFGPVANTMPTPLFNFEGISNVNGVLPPDTDGDVGRSHYVQIVNLSLAVWDINSNPPTRLLGPISTNALWAGFGGICETNNDGDPIVLYDHLADRWMVSQFALNFPNDFHQCIAISQTGDPTGSWYLYDFLISTTKMNDYPKFGLWPDGWYMSINQFDGNTFDWAGAGAVAFERDKMLNGQAAKMVYFDNPDSSLGGMLPSDLDGDALPPAGSPNYFVQADDGFPDQLQVWGFHVDWTTLSNSTFTQTTEPCRPPRLMVICAAATETASPNRGPHRVWIPSLTG